jgi:tetratricopeptide (TPR) repeat protein
VTRRGRPPRPAGRSSAAAPVRTAAPRWPVALVVLAPLVTYLNALNRPFLFDDAGAIVDNPTIRSLWGSLAGGPAQLPTAGRPIPNFTFAVNYAIGSVAPFGYHLFNLAVHIGCALVLFALLRRVLGLPRLASIVRGRENGLALAAALVWSIHPLTSELVDYVTQRTESLMAFHLLVTLYAGVRAAESASDRARRRWSVLSVVACAIGMACKESMVTAPVLMLLLDATFISDGVRDAFRRRRGYYLALFATWIVLGVLILEGPRWRSAGFTSGIAPWTYFLNQPALILRYLRLVVWPVRQVVDYGTPVPTTIGAVWPWLLIVSALGIGTIALWFWRPAIAFVASWVFITLAPTSSFLPISTEVGAERRMYLPLAALVVLAVVAMSRLLDRVTLPRYLRVAQGVTAAACVILAALTVLRNHEYATAIGIWQTAVDRYPSGRAHYNLGLELKAAGRRDEALQQYRLAAATSPQAHYALGFEAAADGRHQDAIDEYQTFIRLQPFDIGVPRAYHQVGRSYLALGRPADAAAAFREMLARSPGNIDALSGLGDSLLAADRLPEAVAAYQQLLRRAPGNVTALFNMGLALSKLDRDAEARDAFAAVVQIQPRNVAAHVNLAYALANTNRLGESLREFQLAASLETDPAGRAQIQQAIAQLMGH